MRIAILLVGCLATLGQGVAQHSATQAAISRFEKRLAGDVATDGMGSVAAAVCVGDRVIWERAFGWADVEKQWAATPRTIYRIGSISKSVTAVLMARLAESGELEMDQRVTKYLPEVGKLLGEDGRAAVITLRQLASHTSGLVREPRLRGAASGPIGKWQSKILESIPRTGFRDAPGKSYSYSNIGYGMLGFTLERAAGKPFMKMVEGRIFKPLGMSSSTFIIDAKMRPRLATGYVRRRGEISSDLPTREHVGRGYKVPNGGVYSTAADLCRFIAGVNGSSKVSILGAKTRAEVLRVQTPGNATTGYGLGFSIRTIEGVQMIGHGGSVAGYTANIVFDPKSKIGVAILRNYNRGATSLGGVNQSLLMELVAAAGK